MPNQNFLIHFQREGQKKRTSWQSDFLFFISNLAYYNCYRIKTKSKFEILRFIFENRKIKDEKSFEKKTFDTKRGKWQILQIWVGWEGHRGEQYVSFRKFTEV